MNEEKASGIALRVRPFTETSLVVNWLTREFGRVSTVAKGARRAKSPYLGKLDLYYECAFSYQRSRRSELHTLREVTLQGTNAELRRDIRHLSLAGYAGTLLELGTESDTPVTEVFDLFREFLSALPKTVPCPALLYAFEAKLLSNLGHGPNLEHPSISPMARESAEDLLADDFNNLSALAGATGRELHAFLFHSLEQAFGRVPSQREKAIRAVR